MSLTNEQEAKVLQIIDAFNNGKRLSDLPEVGNTNPFDLSIEVLDGGESKQARLATLLPYVEDQCAYGIEWNTTISTTPRTRVGNMAFHRSLPIQARMRGCLLTDAGKVVEYLSPANWSAYTRDGSRGQVMVELPAHYRKFETVGTVRRAWVSDYPLPGYHRVPLMYISAYEATMERSTGKLCSIANMGIDFRGGNNQADWDGTYRTVLGRPVTNKSRTAFRAAARLRGAGTQWNCLDYNAYKSLYWLYQVEYANGNCQAAFNAAKDNNGYTQGGMGNGVTTLTNAEWTTLNGRYPFVPCGTTDSLGNASGEVAYEVMNADGGVVKTIMAARYRGVENPFGHIWKWTDGVNVEVKTEADGGTSKLYVATNPGDYVDNGYTNYQLRGLEARAEGYTKELVFGEQGEPVAAAVGAGSTTYWCDYHYTNVASSSLRGLLFGGGADYGANAGFSSAASSCVPSAAGANVGSRLCFIPSA
jgi:hypothetical protein